MTDSNVVYMFPDNAFGVVFLPTNEDEDVDVDVDALIDEGNALIASWPTVAEVEAQRKAERRKHLRLV